MNYSIQSGMNAPTLMRPAQTMPSATRSDIYRVPARKNTIPPRVNGRRVTG